jgi:hypothetical protein
LVLSALLLGVVVVVLLLPFGTSTRTLTDPDLIWTVGDTASFLAGFGGVLTSVLIC